jgi:outer membrane lipoprotein carrier protein
MLSRIVLRLLAAALVLALGRAPSAAAEPAVAPPPTAVRVQSGVPRPAAGRLPTAQVVDRVQRRYDAAQDFRADFEQTLSSAVMRRKTQSAGEVLLKKPGLMRWNYRAPEPRMYLSDGAVLWLYEPDDGQAFKQDLRSSQLPAALAFLTGTGKLAEEFEIESVAPTDPGVPKVSGASDYRLALHPRQAQPQIRSIVFVVDPGTFEVRETIITDGQGNENDVRFSNIRTNTHLPAATFHFSPPPGVRIIDTAKLAR